MALPPHDQNRKIDPRNHPASKVLIWIFLGVVIASFLAFIAVRPVLRVNSTPDKSIPAKPSSN